MRLSSNERTERRESFRRMRPYKKIEYILSYYKAILIPGILLLILLGSGIHRHLTQKTPVLYLAALNTTWGSVLNDSLTTDYLTSRGYDPKKQEVYEYLDLYLSNDASAENHSLAYASQMKLLGSIDAEQLDIVLMNREAYDILSQSGVLLELSSLRDSESALYEQIAPLLIQNAVILSDNELEVTLGEAEERETVTKQAENGLDLSELPLFRSSGMDGALYLGIIANTPRLPEAITYIRYLTEHS